MENINDLQIGKAGEYLVCADLILSGLIAFPSEQGLPFDIVVEHNNKLLRCQVKATRGAKSIPQRANPIPAYIFHIGTNGNGNRRKKYNISQVDFFALVCLDTKRIAYLPFFDCQTTMNFRVPELKGSYHDEKGDKIKIMVREMYKGGISPTEIANELNMKLSNVYKYTSKSADKPQKGGNSGVYFDSFPLNLCLEKLK